MGARIKKKRVDSSKNKSKKKTKPNFIITQSTKSKKKTGVNLVTTINALHLKKTKIRRKQYSKECLDKAFEAIDKGFSYRKAADTFGVPVTTIYRAVKNEVVSHKKPGPASVLSSDEEQRIVDWLLARQVQGYSVTKTELLDNIQSYVVNKNNPFTNNRPGRHWYESFRKRHPEVTVRKAQNLISERLVTEEDLKEWFDDIGKYLESKGLIDIDSSRVFNCDETGILFCPTQDKVFARRGAQVVYQVFEGNEHERLTVLFMYGANGAEAPPMIVYPYKENVPEKVLANVPGHWGIGISETGWMTQEIFYEYITNVFYKWLKEKGIVFPVVVYLDGHCSHLTIPLMEFGREKEIEFICLVPHSTHIMQPLDTSFFHTLKDAWVKELSKWKREKRVRKLTHETFSIVLIRALKTITNIDSIMKNGYRSCGLLPFNPKAIDYNCLKKNCKKKKAIQSQNTNFSNNENEIQLKAVEKKVPSDLLRKFIECQASGMWTGDIEKKGLFEFWLSLKLDVLKIKQEKID